MHMKSNERELWYKKIYNINNEMNKIEKKFYFSLLKCRWEENLFSLWKRKKLNLKIQIHKFISVRN